MPLLYRLEKSYLLYPYLVFEKGKNKINPFREGPLIYQISNIFTHNNQIRSQTSKTFACNDIQNSSSTDIGGMINLEIFIDFLDKKKFITRRIFRNKNNF